MSKLGVKKKKRKTRDKEKDKQLERDQEELFASAKNQEIAELVRAQSYAGQPYGVGCDNVPFLYSSHSIDPHHQYPYYMMQSQMLPHQEFNPLSQMNTITSLQIPDIKSTETENKEMEKNPHLIQLPIDNTKQPSPFHQNKTESEQKFKPNPANIDIAFSYPNNGTIENSNYTNQFYQNLIPPIPAIPQNSISNSRGNFEFPGYFPPSSYSFEQNSRKATEEAGFSQKHRNEEICEEAATYSEKASESERMISLLTQIEERERNTSANCDLTPALNIDTKMKHCTPKIETPAKGTTQREIEIEIEANDANLNLIKQYDQRVSPISTLNMLYSQFYDFDHLDHLDP